MEKIVIEVPLSLNEPREVTLNGVPVPAELGPMDFPRRLRLGICDNPGRCIMIEFLYELDNDERTLQKDSGGAVFHFGSKSGRLMIVELPLPQSVEAAHVQLALKPIVDELLLLRQATINNFRHRAYYGALSEAIIPSMAHQIALSLGELRQSHC